MAKRKSALPTNQSTLDGYFLTSKRANYTSSNASNSGNNTPSEPQKESEYNFFGTKCLKIDSNHLRRHKNTSKMYQVYYDGESIAENEDTLILRDFIGYNGSQYICRYHQGNNCPNHAEKLKSDVRRTIFNHVASYFFTYRCSTCAKKYNTLTNLSIHLNSAHY